MKTSKKYAGCVWAQKVTTAGLADGPIFKLGNAYPLTLQQSVKAVDQVSAMCDTPGQILESRNELEAISGEMTLYQYGATEIGWALGAEPVAMTGTGATLTPTAVTAPAPGEWIDTGHKNYTAFTLTNTGATVTYTSGVDYQVNLSLGLWTPLAGGAIAEDASLMWSGTYAAPTGYQLDVGTVLQNNVRLFGTLTEIKSGAKVNFNLKLVSLVAKGGLTLISEPKTDYESLGFDLKLITPPGHTSPATIEGVPAE